MGSIILEEELKDSVKGSLMCGFKERRGRLEIIAAVLSVTRNGSRKTEIVYKTNLNFARLDRYLLYLKEKELIENSESIYKTTEKGEEFLRDYQTIEELLLT